MREETKKEVLSWIKVIVLSFIIAFVIKTYLFRPVYAKSVSMEPTLRENEILILWKLDYVIGDPERGDIVVIGSQEDTLEHLSLLKRVIGLPGEEIEIEGGKVFIDGKELEPDFTQATTLDNGFDGSVLPEDKYFMMGDNRTNSRDSRDNSVGFIDRDSIEGKVVFRLWPLNRFGFVK